MNRSEELLSKLVPASESDLASIPAFTTMVFEDGTSATEYVEPESESGIDNGVVVETESGKIYVWDGDFEKFYEVPSDLPFEEKPGEELQLDLTEVPGEKVANEAIRAVRMFTAANEASPRSVVAFSAGKKYVKQVCPASYKKSHDGKTCIKMTAQEVQHRKAGAKKRAVKIKGKLKQILAKRKIDEKARKAAGL